MKYINTSLRHYVLPNIFDDGWKFISFMIVITLLAAIIWIPAGVVLFLLTAWCFYNFRDPQRVTPLISDAVIAPADGIVSAIIKEKGPDCLGLGHKTFIKICITPRFFDSNVYRCPIKSKVNKYFYDCGKRFSASFAKENIAQETLSVLFKTSTGQECVLRQTAVFCSPRLKPIFKQGEEILAGKRIGFSRFGAYTDILLPEKTTITACLGQTLISGETIIADLQSDAPRIEGEIR